MICAIAADIHGKNHHLDGSFMNHVTTMELVTPTGVFEVTPASDPEVFWATAGAMGLTGMVTKATVTMMPIETSYVTVDTDEGPGKYNPEKMPQLKPAFAKDGTVTPANDRTFRFGTNAPTLRLEGLTIAGV